MVVERSFIVSDLHLGSVYFHHEAFISWLDALPRGVQLVLNGDIIDDPRSPLPEEHRAVLDRLVGESQIRPVIWVSGNHDAEIAEGDLAAEPMDDVERGARRPPPVNSDTLPLPWTGRLGYVRSEDPGSSHGQPAGLAQTTKTEELTENRDLGMPKHLFESFEPAGILLQDLSHELHH